MKWNTKDALHCMQGSKVKNGQDELLPRGSRSGDILALYLLGSRLQPAISVRTDVYVPQPDQFSSPYICTSNGMDIQPYDRLLEKTPLESAWDCRCREMVEQSSPLWHGTNQGS